jgi:hypothetical protein
MKATGIATIAFLFVLASITAANPKITKFERGAWVGQEKLDRSLLPYGTDLSTWRITADLGRNYLRRKRAFISGTEGTDDCLLVTTNGVKEFYFHNYSTQPQTYVLQELSQPREGWLYNTIPPGEVHQTTVPHFKLFHKPKPLSPDMKPLHD